MSVNRKSLLLVVVLTMILAVPLPASAVPGNDDSGSATVINTDPFADSVDLTGSTLEGGEPTPSCEYGTPDGSVWYTYTPGTSGTMTLHASGGFRSTSYSMAVYETSPAGTEIACHAESSPDVTFSFTSGTTYYIGVRGEFNASIPTLDFTASVHGAISGTVTDSLANPIQNVIVQATQKGSFFYVVGSTTTDASGNYSISLEPGSYYLTFNGISVPYATEFYNDKSTQAEGDQVAVTGSTDTVIDAVLDDDSTISGTVTNILADPIQDVTVKVYSEGGTFKQQTTTDASGNYSLNNLKGATYLVEFVASGWTDEWFDNAATQGAATPIVVAAGTTETADATLVADGNDAFIGATEIASLPHDDSASLQSTGLDVDEPTPSCGSVLANGSRWWSYTPSGNDRLALEATQSGASTNVAVYTGASLAAMVEVGCTTEAIAWDATSGVTYWIQAFGRSEVSSSDVVFRLGRAGTVDVTLLHGRTGAPVVSETVCFTLASAAYGVGCSSTDGSGGASVEVPEGSYKAYATTGGDLFLRTYYDGASDHATAAPIVVAAGATVPIDLTADMPAEITGTVIDRVGDPVASAAVRVYQSTGDLYRTTTTDGSGVFAFGPDREIDAGTWYLEVCPDGDTCTLYGNTLSGGDPTAGTPLVAALNDLLTADVTIQTGVIPFEDTPGHQFYDEIAWLSTQGITGGCSTDPILYCPDDTVTRGQMASFLARALDLPDSSTDWFTDDDGSVHEANINKLADAGITLGFAGGLYKPDDPVRRDHMASFLARALDLPGSVTDWFVDDDGSTHEANINRLADSGITRGCSASDVTIYCPANLVTRGQMAAFLFRALAP